MKAIRSAVVVLAAAAGSAHAAGFALDTQSARATGMAQAVTALVDDPSALFYNPGGIATGKGFGLQVGDSPIMPSLRFTPTGGSPVDTPSSVSPPPHAFLRWGITDELAVGLGFTAPFGAAAKWPEAWMGRTASTGSSLAVYELAPTLAVNLFDKRVRLGAGLRLMRGTVELHRDIRFTPDSYGSALIGGVGSGESYALGLQADVLPKLLTVGVSYRGGAHLPFEGRAHFSDVPAEFQGQVVDQAVRTAVDLPGTLRAGVGVRPLQALALAADVVWTEWSSFPSLRIDSADGHGTLSDTPKAWQNTVGFNVGGEYGVTDALQVRAGFSFDPTPSPTSTLTPDLPDADRYRVSVGAGYKVADALRFDLGYQLVLLKGTQSTVPASTGLQGTYGGTAHVLSLTAGLTL